MNTKIQIIIGVALIPVAIFLWPTALGGETEFLLVQGNSMLPTIEPGSFVITKEKDSYEVGDVVSYSTSKFSAFQGRTIVHRIMEQTDEGFIIQGDNNEKPDPGIVKSGSIRGEVVFFTPFLGYVLVFLRNPLVMGVLAVIMLMSQFKSKKKKEKLDLEDKPLDLKPKKKKKSNNYVLFLPALILHLMSYVVIQISFEAGINDPRADPLTSFFFGVTDVYTASTISFALYFILIIGLYLWAKNHDTIPRMKLPDGKVLTLKKKTNAVLATARIVWLLLVISGGLFLYLMLQDLRAELT